MAQFQRDLNALARLLRMPSTSNVGAAPSNRALDVMSGEDWLEPTELELLQAQETEGVGKVSTPAGSVYMSRERLRDSGMQSIRRKLGLDAIEHQQSMERTLAPKRIEGQFQVEAAERSARAAADRMQAQQDAIMERVQLQQAGMDRRQQESERIGDERKAMPSAPGSRQAVPTDGMLKRLADARSGFQGATGKIGRLFRMDGGRTAYTQALTDLLDRKGTLRGLSQAASEAKAQGMSAEQALADAAANGVQLDPYEQEYLKLVLGQ